MGWKVNQLPKVEAGKLLAQRNRVDDHFDRGVVKSARGAAQSTNLRADPPLLVTVPSRFLHLIQ
jgi:hypothetical protein